MPVQEQEKEVPQKQMLVNDRSKDTLETSVMKTDMERSQRSTENSNSGRGSNTASDQGFDMDRQTASVQNMSVAQSSSRAPEKFNRFEQGNQPGSFYKTNQSNNQRGE